MARVWTRTTLSALLALAGGAHAEHLLQSIPLDSPDGGFVEATSFVHSGELLYVAGGFDGTIDFNPNGDPFVYESQCVSDAGCSFVAAYDANAEIVWLDTFAGTAEDDDQLLVARSGGGVYFLVDFSWDLAYEPDTTEPVFHSEGGRDIAAIALDASGAFAGGAQLGADVFAALRHVRAFESAPGIVDLAWTSRSGVDPSGRDAMVGQIDLTTGIATAPLIALEAANPASFVEIHDQRPDATGRYVCGSLQGTVELDTHHAGRPLVADVVTGFVAHYGQDGALQWLATLTPDSGSASCNALALDANGLVWATGTFDGTVEVVSDGSAMPAEIPLYGLNDAFLVAFDALGGIGTTAHLGGDSNTLVFPNFMEAAEDGTLTLTGVFEGVIAHGFAGTLDRASTSDYDDAFVLVVMPDLTTRYFGQIAHDAGYTAMNTLALTGPMRFETIASMSAPTGGNAYLDYALPPEHALLHNDGTYATAYARYDLDAILVAGFDTAAP